LNQLTVYSHPRLGESPGFNATQGGGVEVGMEEDWREAVGWPLYEVSSIGRVRSWNRYGPGNERATSPHMLTLFVGHGYLRAGLRDKRKRGRSVSVASLVAEAFICPRPTGLVLRHLDGQQTNNVPHNLAWGTLKENGEDRVRHGTSLRGEKSFTAKLNEAQVLEIRASNETGVALSKRFGITPSAISGIRKRRTWRHLP